MVDNKADCSAINNKRKLTSFFFSSFMLLNKDSFPINSSASLEFIKHVGLNGGVVCELHQRGSNNELFSFSNTICQLKCYILITSFPVYQTSHE